MLFPQKKLEKTEVKFKTTVKKKEENRHESHKGITSSLFTEITEVMMFLKTVYFNMFSK